MICLLWSTPVDCVRRAPRPGRVARRLQCWPAPTSQDTILRPLRVELNLGVLVHEHDDATGAFQASLGNGQIGQLARRPRAEEPWDLQWNEVQHRWSTPRWDWALSFHDEEPTAHSVEALKQQLGDEN